MKRILSVILCILMSVTAVVSVTAAEAGSITVLFRHEEKAVEGAAFEIYKAAEKTDAGYTLTGAFSSYPVELNDELGSEELKAAASTLSAYAARDKVTPLMTGKTDENGTLRFGELEDGLYLLVGSPVLTGDTLLLPQPMLVSVPFENTDGTKDHDVVTEPKYDVRKTTYETVTRRALKIWKDTGNESNRPKEITVQLLCDGNIYDEKVLSDENNWAYTWEGLDAEHNWQLTEKEVPNDYTVEITQEGITFTVTNTNDDPPPPPPSTTDVPENPSNPNTPNTPNTPGKPKLPQTGLLWWPVPVLAGTGAISLFLGIYVMMRKKEEPDE